MNRILISYDLKNPDRDYAKVESYLKKLILAKRPLQSVWIVKTRKIPEEIRDELKKIVDQNDKILVVDTTSKSASWSNIDSSNWIKNLEL